MNKDQCFFLGKITKPFGFKGDVVFFLDVDSPDLYAGLDSAFVDVKGSLVPYFFHISAINGNKAVAHFDDITSEQALALVGHELYLPLEMLPPLSGNQFYFHEVVGFRVVDDAHGDIGTISSIIEYPAQPLFQIDCHGVEILLPIVDPVIQRLDRANKTIFVSAPEGLIDLYLDQNISR